MILKVCVFLLFVGALIWNPSKRAQKTTPVTEGAGPTTAKRIELDLQALSEPLHDLVPEDEKVLDDAIQLIREKQHLTALAVLTSLAAGNPRNSGLHVLRAYVLLELGDVAGALGDAKDAEASRKHTAYECWFLARVAYLAGNKPLCRRELGHLEKARSPYRADAEELIRKLGGEGK